MSKFLDERGKLFGLINPLDLGILLLLMVLGVKIVSDYRPEPLKLKQRTVILGLLVKDVPFYLVESIVVGQDLFLDEAHVYLGKIRLKKFKPAEILLKTGEQLVLTTSPRNFDLRLELQRSGRVVTGPYGGVYLGKIAVRVGNRLKAHTTYSSIAGEVEYLRIKR